jgi:hypothetical protein
MDPLTATRHWLEKAVIGLNLCPFAKAVHTQGRIRWVLSTANDTDALLHDLVTELQWLSNADPQSTDTTLIVHPQVLTDFLDYNDFLDVADAALDELNLAGVLQVASFHPQYQFAGTAMDDIENCTNRSPYPCLHLLREESVDKAVAAYPDAADIFERNQQRLQQLGWAGWQNLMASQS